MQKKVVVIGGGIVGLATAWQLLEKHPELELSVLEKEDDIAQHQTSHNSGVIHSGIYYKPGSLKASNCRKGYHLLLEFCREQGIRHEVTGKIIAATTAEQAQRLDGILERGHANGLEGIRKISSEEAREIEPHVHCSAALWVPQTGIIDFAEVARCYRGLIEQKGARIITGARVTGIHKEASGRHRILSTHAEYAADITVNCAGLYADKIARMTAPDFRGQIIPFRGEYYNFRPEAENMVRNLIYPVPNPNFPFLGVHFTRMIQGGIEAGPNAVLAFAREGYTNTTVHWGELWQSVAFPGLRKVVRKYWRNAADEMQRSFSKKAFVRSLQALLPNLKGDQLEKGRAGVRAQLCMPDGALTDDFLLLEQPGIVHVVNAPSPAATASLAIGAYVAERAWAALQAK